MNLILSKFFFRNIKVINFYPPLLGAGVWLKKIDREEISFLVHMKLRFWNRNYRGSHYGGSLYSMCDPWYVFIFALYFGTENYIIWDKSASIQYLKPGKGRVTAKFVITPEELKVVAQEMEKGKKVFTFHTYIVDHRNERIARVEKEVYIRKK